MIDYAYTLRQHEFSEKKMYATSFEFGTLGDDVKGQIGSPIGVPKPLQMPIRRLWGF